MKTIIAGSRSISDINILINTIQKSDFIISEIVSGTANGVDKLGENYASIHNIPVSLFPANWNKYGKSAGYKRNQQMAKYVKEISPPGQLICIWDGISPGSQHMIQIAKQYNLHIFVHNTLHNSFYHINKISITNI